MAYNGEQVSRKSWGLALINCLANLLTSPEHPLLPALVQYFRELGTTIRNHRDKEMRRYLWIITRCIIVNREDFMDKIGYRIMVTVLSAITIGIGVIIWNLFQELDLHDPQVVSIIFLLFILSMSLIFNYIQYRNRSDLKTTNDVQETDLGIENDRDSFFMVPGYIRHKGFDIEFEAKISTDDHSQYSIYIDIDHRCTICRDVLEVMREDDLNPYFYCVDCNKSFVDVDDYDFDEEIEIKEKVKTFLWGKGIIQ